jgi:hypothetical protein
MSDITCQMSENAEEGKNRCQISHVRCQRMPKREKTDVRLWWSVPLFWRPSLLASQRFSPPLSFQLSASSPSQLSALSFFRLPASQRSSVLAF